MAGCVSGEPQSYGTGRIGSQLGIAEGGHPRKRRRRSGESPVNAEPATLSDFQEAHLDERPRKRCGAAIGLCRILCL